jgi:hypothetical protein
MGKEEVEKVEDRVKALEENQLLIAKEFSKQGVVFFLTLAGMKVAALKEDKYKSFEKYMKDKIAEASKKIGESKDVDEVIMLSGKFTDDCIAYTESQLK